MVLVEYCNYPTTSHNIPGNKIRIVLIEKIKEAVSKVRDSLFIFG
jgi:hypothetical protein